MKQPKFVICINNSEYPASLEKRKLYEVIPDSSAKDIDHIRIIDESGEDYLYPSSLFIDAQLPRAVESALISAA